MFFSSVPSCAVPSSNQLMCTGTMEIYVVKPNDKDFGIQLITQANLNRGVFDLKEDDRKTEAERQKNTYCPACKIETYNGEVVGNSNNANCAGFVLSSLARLPRLYRSDVGPIVELTRSNYYENVGIPRLKPGSLVTYSDNNGRVQHVAVVVSGQGQDAIIEGKDNYEGALFSYHINEEDTLIMKKHDYFAPDYWNLKDGYELSFKMERETCSDKPGKIDGKTELPKDKVIYPNKLPDYDFMKGYIKFFSEKPQLPQKYDWFPDEPKVELEKEDNSKCLSASGKSCTITRTYRAAYCSDPLKLNPGDQYETYTQEIEYECPSRMELRNGICTDIAKKSGKGKILKTTKLLDRVDSSFDDLQKSGKTYSELYVDTRDYSTTAYYVTGPYTGTVTIQPGQKLLLSGDSEGKTEWTVDNFLLFEISDGATPKRFLIGATDPVYYGGKNGKRIDQLGPNKFTFSPNEIDLAEYIPVGVPVDFKVSAIDFGGGARVTDVYLITEESSDGAVMA